MKYEYVNFTSELFHGFYESDLWNSDMISEILKDADAPEGSEVNFEKFTQDVAQTAGELLADYVTGNIVKSMKFLRLSSPDYYNFETDKLVLDVDLDLDRLESFIRAHRPKFDKYLHDYFSDYDGFISFVANNYADFMRDYERNHDDRSINTMLEYYVLSKVCVDELADELSEYAREAAYQYIEPPEDEAADRKLGGAK